jgi:hypothetical protein
MPKIIKTLLQKNSTAEQVENSVYKPLKSVYYSYFCVEYIFQLH